MQRVTPLEAVLRRDRAVVIAGLVGVASLAWAYMVYLALDMESMGMAMPQTDPWGAVDFALTFVMWAVMMVPTAAPMVLVFATINRKRREEARPVIPTGVFVLGYVAVWTGFAAAATFAQWGLHSAALLSSMMVSTSSVLGGGLLLSAGIFQFTRLKYVCLTHCRTPLGFLMFEWRQGTGGALVMGLRHGVYCLGCCWILMALLFVLGVMNLLWIAALAAFVLLEKVAPAGPWVSRVAGVALLTWGALMVAGEII